MLALGATATAAGVVNTLAGGGSLLTVPLLGCWVPRRRRPAIASASCSSARGSLAVPRAGSRRPAGIAPVLLPVAARLVAPVFCASKRSSSRPSAS
jgi:uncharacterized membrane protein YfcA